LAGFAIAVSRFCPSMEGEVTVGPLAQRLKIYICLRQLGHLLW
jgi:hypothetical protein